MGKLRTRAEVPAENRWATEDIYVSDEAWEEDLKQLKEKISGFNAYCGHLSESAEMLYGCLRFDESIDWNLERLYCYAHLNADVDTTNVHYQKMLCRVETVWSQANAESAYIEPEILAMDENRLKELMEDPSADKNYERELELILRRKQHTLSPEVEQVLAKTEEITGGPSNIFTMFNNADIKFPEIRDEEGNMTQMSHGRYGAFLESRNRDVRRDAFKAMYGTFDKYKNTLSAVYQANLKQAWFYANVRKFSSSRAMYLADTNVPEEVYDNLIETVHEFNPLMYRYVALRKKCLGLDELHMYDLYTPIVPSYDRKFSYEEAKQTVLKALAPMGEEYLSVFREGLNGRWIDHMENEGKRSGAYCSGPHGTHPYVLMSYQGTLDNVFTLAHEMGHAMHSYYSDKYQTFNHSHYKIFVAEVASTCNENLLNHYLLRETKDKTEKAYILNHFLDSFKGTIFRQTMFAEFEKITHEKIQNGEVLTVDVLCDIYRKLNRLYFGDGIVIDDEITLEWARIPHFYSPFYVYQYATGFSAAIALSERILNVEGAVTDYFGFLKGGCSKDPIDLLKGAGVDISSPEPIRSAMKVFEEVLTELEALLEES